MPTYVTGDMWSVFLETDLFCITTNSTLRRDGALVMGGGIAKQAQDRLPGIGRLLGMVVKNLGPAAGRYGLIVVDAPGPVQTAVGAFQTKRYWREPSSLDLIENSVARLLEWIERERPERVDLAFPGIGLGGLRPDDVRPLLAPLPECVHVWSLPPQPEPSSEQDQS